MSSDLLIQHFGEARAKLIIAYLVSNNCELKIKAARKTKLGDFSVRGGHKSITINNNLNAYRFALTLVHEIAHLMTYERHKWKVKPHGNEWQENYRILLDLWKIKGLFSKSEQLTTLYQNEYDKPTVCSGIQMDKERILSSYDDRKGEVMLSELPQNQRFKFRNQVYSKGDLRRTRILCRRIENNKAYTIHKASWVQPLD